MFFAALLGPDVGTGLLQNSVTGLQCRICTARCRSGTCSHLCIIAAAAALAWCCRQELSTRVQRGLHEKEKSAGPWALVSVLIVL